MLSSIQLHQTDPVHSVAIVGLGPKGLYCLERLLAEFHAGSLGHHLNIHVFNHSEHFGASPIYDPDQPEYILVNVSVGEIDFWKSADPPCVAGRGLNFVNWYQEKFAPNQPLTGNEYLSRALVGRYLKDSFQSIRENLPPGVTLSCHVGEVVDVKPRNGDYSMQFVPTGGQPHFIRADKILLATGHSRVTAGPDEKRYEEFAARHEGVTFIPGVYPVVRAMATIPARARVAMKGMGLSFIDAVLELTEGRGGRFQRCDDGTLSYLASGSEPQSILPFCRSGLPMAPKADDLPIAMRPLTFLTSTAIAGLKRKSAGGKLDLDRDLWPLFELEMELNYYRVAMGPDRAALDSCGSDGRAMREVIESFLQANPGCERFDYRRAIDPLLGLSFQSGKEFTAFVARYMEQEIARARLGQAGCGIKAALDIWYEVRKELGSVLRFGGLTPASHRQLIEYHFPRFKRIVFGPPAINIEKLLALARAGLLDFSVARNPCVTLDEAGACFQLRCDAIAGDVARAEILVDTRSPSTNIPRDATPLYRNLCRRGMVRAYENSSVDIDQPGFSPGAIDMTEGSNFVIDAAGVTNRDIAVIGIPTEGNLVGNKTIVRDGYPGIWAAQVMKQLSEREQSSQSQPMVLAKAAH